MALMNPTWSAGSDYSANDLVTSDGVVYKALNAITGNSNNQEPFIDETNWALLAVQKIQSENSLIQAIRLEINVDNEMINQTIPLYIQLAEVSFQTRIRAPIQRSRVSLTTDADSKVTIPGDLLQVINMRIEGEASGSTLLSRGGTEILAGNYEEYKNLQRYYQGDDNAFGNGFTSTYEAPVYWFDSSHFWIAPDLDTGTKIELYYYSAIPSLGSTVFLVDANGNALNSAGMTLAQWVAEGGGNDADNFVQATERVTNNWFVQAAPQMLLYGALVQAASYLHNDERAPMWQERFKAAENETKDLIQRFEEGRHHIQQIHNAYSI